GGLAIAAVRRQVNALAEQELRGFHAPVSAGIAEGALNLLFAYASPRRAVRKEEIPHTFELAHARGYHEVEARSSLRQEFSGERPAVVQAGLDRGRLVTAGAPMLDGGAMAKEQVEQFELHASFLGMNAGGHQTESGSSAPVDVGFGVD